MIVSFRGKKLSINGEEIEFPIEVRNVIEFSRYVVVLLSPKIAKSEDWEKAGFPKWQQDWSNLKNGNVFAINTSLEVVWGWEYLSSGISKYSTHWIKPNAVYDDDTVVWISHIGLEYLVSLPDGKILEKIDTKYIR